VGLGAVALGLSLSVFATAAYAGTVNANPNSITYAVQNSNPPTPLTGTNLASSTQFDLHLPANAACSYPGSTGEQFISFLVPEGTNLSALTYSKFPPQADQGTAPLLANSQAFPPETSASNSPAGLITPSYLSDVEWDLLIDDGFTVQGTQLPTGKALIPTGHNTAQYEVGVACLAGSGNGGGFAVNAITDYWAVPVTFVLNGTNGCQDPEALFCWNPGGGSGPVVPEAPLAVGLPVGGVAVIGSAIFITRRRRRHAGTSVPASL